MYELFRKDIGLCRNVLIGGMIALALPYVAVIVYSFNTSGLSDQQNTEFLSLGLLGASQTSVWLSLFSIAFLGGFVVAGERRDRSAEFLAYLPPAKSLILASKALLCFFWIAFVGLIYFSVTDFLVPWMSGGEYQFTALARETWMVSCVICAVFGVSWLVGCIFQSPVVAVLAGLTAPYGIWMATWMLQLRFGWNLEYEASVHFYSILFLAMGAISFFAGWLHYISRVEP